MKTCRTCRYSVKANQPEARPADGFCHYNPPTLYIAALPNGDQTLNSAFPPINLDTFVCGKHKRRWWGGVAHV